MRLATYHLATAVVGAGLLCLSGQPSSFAKGMCSGSVCPGAGSRYKLADLHNARNGIEHTLWEEPDHRVASTRAHYKANIPALIKKVELVAPKLAKQMGKSFKATKALEEEPKLGEFEADPYRKHGGLAVPEKAARREYNLILRRALKHLNIKEMKLREQQKPPEQQQIIATDVRGRLADVREARREVKRMAEGAAHQFDRSAVGYYRRVIPTVIRHVALVSPGLAAELQEGSTAAQAITAQAKQAHPSDEVPVMDAAEKTGNAYEELVAHVVDRLDAKEAVLKKLLAQREQPRQKPPQRQRMSAADVRSRLADIGDARREFEEIAKGAAERSTIKKARYYRSMMRTVSRRLKRLSPELAQEIRAGSKAAWGITDRQLARDTEDRPEFAPLTVKPVERAAIESNAAYGKLMKRALNYVTTEERELKMQQGQGARPGEDPEYAEELSALEETRQAIAAQNREQKVQGAEQPSGPGRQTSVPDQKEQKHLTFVSHQKEQKHLTFVPHQKEQKRLTFVPRNKEQAAEKSAEPARLTFVPRQ